MESFAKLESTHQPKVQLWLRHRHLLVCSVRFLLLIVLRWFDHSLLIIVSIDFTVAVVTYSVPAFEVDFDLSGDFLKTPLPSRVPMNNYIGYQNPEMDMNSFDRHISNAIPRWMDGTVGDGEEGAISRNDALFNVYKNLANLGKFSRNKHEDSTVATTRSDRTDKYEGVSLVKIEEKDDSLQEAIDDLARKARWLPHYARLPFIFGIAVTPDQFEIYTLHADNTMVRVFSADLNDVVDRWLCVVAAVNIARTLKMFVDQRRVIRSIRFDKWHVRNNKSIRLDVNFAEVEFKDRCEFDRMRLFYNATAEVPHLEHTCVDPAFGPFSDDKKRIRLVPVGVERKPDSVGELVTAIQHVCECLFRLHELGYYHCDVRWTNIIDFYGAWYLIDSEYACHRDERDLLATRSATTIKKRFVLDPSKPWGPLFDLYQVGMLLVDSTATTSSVALAALRDHLLSRTFTTVTVKRALANLLPPSCNVLLVDNSCGVLSIVRSPSLTQ